MAQSGCRAAFVNGRVMSSSREVLLSCAAVSRVATSLDPKAKTDGSRRMGAVVSRLKLYMCLPDNAPSWSATNSDPSVRIPPQLRRSRRNTRGTGVFELVSLRPSPRAWYRGQALAGPRRTVERRLRLLVADNRLHLGSSCVSAHLIRLCPTQGLPGACSGGRLSGCDGGHSTPATVMRWSSMLDACKVSVS
ncbi:hypothetical protein LX36DRAFT_328522 [Colletotrichum falcatum]|nr:hypothetical protein LX36DRAFT_328522 [Colletotrichum falcatum]